MTKLFLVFLSLVSMLAFWLGVSIGRPSQPEKLPTKVVHFADSTGTRYFLFGYAIADVSKGNIAWVSQSGKLPTIDVLIKELHKEKNVPAFKSKEFVILGIYEFKNEREFLTFTD